MAADFETGILTAIMADKTFEEVVDYASEQGFPVSRLRAGQRKAQSGDMRVCAILMWRH